MVPVSIKSRIDPVNKIKSRNGPSIKIKPRNDFRNKIKRLETVNYLYIEGNWKRTKLLLQIFLYGPSIKIKPSIDSSIKIIDPVNKIKSRNGPSIKIKPSIDSSIKRTFLSTLHPQNIPRTSPEPTFLEKDNSTRISPG